MTRVRENSCVDSIMREEKKDAIHAEEHDLFGLQKPNKEIILEECLAFKHGLSFAMNVRNTHQCEADLSR